MTIAIAKWLLNTSIPLDEIITYFGKNMKMLDMVILLRYGLNLKSTSLTEAGEMAPQ